MTKRRGSYLIIFLLSAAGFYYFFKRESGSVFSKSAGTLSMNRDQGRFVPEPKTDYVFYSTDTDSGVSMVSIVIFIMVLCTLFFMIKKFRKTKKN